tara:strand:+ start:326 stop:547 length:222 start_codon:yes stop_codon:yes gene_type:complete
MGELSLEGSLQKLKGVLPIAIEAKKLGPKEMVAKDGNKINIIQMLILFSWCDFIFTSVSSIVYSKFQNPISKL